MAFISKFTGPEIDRRLAQGTYDDAVAAGFTGTKEQFDAWIAAYTPAEMEKLNNKQDKEDPMLETENKTVVGAINLLNSEKQDKEDERLATESKIVVDAINELNTRATDLYYNKQDKEDSGLVTEQKTIVGAINEVRLKLQDQDSQKQDKVDNGFATNDKSVVGAVNEIHNELDTCVADYNEHIDEYEVFKANTENTLNSHSTQIGQLTQEKQDKTDFNLATKSKTVVDAINENHASITAEVARSVAEDARLDETKVSYTDISDDTNPDRKTIMLKNHDSLSGYGTDGTTAYNLAMVSKWDKADFGAAGIPINLNGSEAHPTYNDKEELAFVSELSGETGKLAEDIKSLNETVATVKQDLADSVSSINKNMEDGFNTINDDIDNEIRPAIEKNTKDIGVVNNTLTTKINETEEKLQADINYLKPRVTTLESLQIVKVDSDSETYAASYELQDATGKVYGQRINIATDKFIKSVSYANQTLTIVFVLEDGSEYSQNIDVSELMNVYTAGGGITISDTGVVSVSDETLQMIQYSDSEVRRLEKDKIPYVYDEKTQSNINVILPEGGSYLGNYGDENATVAKAAVYDGIKQLELGSSKVHTNINTDSDVTIETSTGKKTIATTDELVNVVNIPIRSLQDKVYTQEEIFDWFGVTSVPELKQKISRGSQMYLRYGILLSGNPMYYKMPIEYTAFESANQIKLVCVGLNTRDDVTSKYEILINLDGTIIEGNSNVKLTLLSLEPNLSNFATKDEVPNVFETKGLTELEMGESSAKIEAALGIDFASLIDIIRENKAVIVDRNSAGDYKACIHASGNISSGNGAANLMFFIGTTPTIYQIQYVNETFALAVTEYAFAKKSDIPDVSNLVSSEALNSALALKQNVTDNSLETTSKTVTGAINEVRTSVEDIHVPYQIDIQALLSASDTESISAAIGTIQALNNVVSENRAIVGSVASGTVGVSIRVLGNVTSLYYILDTVLGYTVNEINITDNSGVLSKQVVTHAFITENRVVNSLNSDETTLPLSAAQGKSLNETKQSKEDASLPTTAKTVVGAIAELKTAVDSKASSDALNAKQNATDQSLQTTDKTVVGAINEVFSKCDNINILFTSGLVNLSSSSSEDEILSCFTGYSSLDEVFTLLGSNAFIICDTSEGYMEVDKINTIFSYEIPARDSGSGEIDLYLSGFLGKWLGQDFTPSTDVYLIRITASGSPGSFEYSCSTGVRSIAFKEEFSLYDITKYVTVSGALSKAGSPGMGTYLIVNSDELNSSTLATTNKTIVGAINEVKGLVDSKSSVGKIDLESDGSGEIFNLYEGIYVNSATGAYSHAEGYRTYAAGESAHAEGDHTSAVKDHSHAEGSYSHALGVASHAEGNYTECLGDYSHAEGSGSVAQGVAAHAEGYVTQTFSDGEHAEGVYNHSYQSDDESVRVVHSVGIGSASGTGVKNRINAHEIKFNGDHYVYGLGGYNGANPAESQTLQEVINSKQATITAGTGLEFEGNTLNVTLDTTVFKVVSVLPDSPAVGDENKIHLVPAESTGTNNLYTEYVWVNSAWEILGEYTSEVDLTPYLKIADAADTYLSKTDATSTYATATNLTAHTSNTENPHRVTAAQVGLGNVDNTSDENKPVSTAQQTALDLKQNITDNSLPTTSKTITGAITEIYNKQTVYTEVPTLTADYNIPANDTFVEHTYIINIGDTVYNVTGDSAIRWAGAVTPVA